MNGVKIFNFEDGAVKFLNIWDHISPPDVSTPTTQWPGFESLMNTTSMTPLFSFDTKSVINLRHER